MDNRAGVPLTVFLIGVAILVFTKCFKRYTRSRTTTDIGSFAEAIELDDDIEIYSVGENRGKQSLKTNDVQTT